MTISGHESTQLPQRGLPLSCLPRLPAAAGEGRGHRVAQDRSPSVEYVAGVHLRDPCTPPPPPNESWGGRSMFESREGLLGSLMSFTVHFNSILPSPSYVSSLPAWRLLAKRTGAISGPPLTRRMGRTRQGMAGVEIQRREGKGGGRGGREGVGGVGGRLGRGREKKEAGD